MQRHVPQRKYRSRPPQSVSPNQYSTETPPKATWRPTFSLANGDYTFEIDYLDYLSLRLLAGSGTVGPERDEIGDEISRALRGTIPFSGSLFASLVVRCPPIFDTSFRRSLYRLRKAYEPHTHTVFTPRNGPQQVTVRGDRRGGAPIRLSGNDNDN